MTEQQAIDIVNELRRIGRECEWAEFKCNNENPDEIAEYISAISNSTAIMGLDVAYLAWGIQDSSMAIVGTDFKPFNAKKGGEPLFNWLIRSIIPQIDIQFVETQIEGQSVVLLMIPKAPNQPVRFGSEAFVRVDSQKRKLKDYPEHARKLWASFDKSTFEAGIALQDIDGPRVLQLIDFSTCFDKLGIALPSDQTGILARLCDEQLIVSQPGGRFDIERQWEDPPSTRGYATSFEAAVAYINSQVEQNEPIEHRWASEISERSFGSFFQAFEYLRRIGNWYRQGDPRCRDLSVTAAGF